MPECNLEVGSLVRVNRQMQVTKQDLDILALRKNQITGYVLVTTVTGMIIFLNQVLTIILMLH